MTKFFLSFLFLIKLLLILNALENFMFSGPKRWIEYKSNQGPNSHLLCEVVH
jgi:hypothetical protein